MAGKYNQDIEDVQAVATPILRHRIVRNYEAEAGVTVEALIDRLKDLSQGTQAGNSVPRTLSEVGAASRRCLRPG